MSTNFSSPRRQSASSFSSEFDVLRQSYVVTAESDLESLSDLCSEVESLGDDEVTAPMETLIDDAVTPAMQTFGDRSVTPPIALPGRHPSVEKALDGMTENSQTMEDTQQATKKAHTGELEGTAPAAFQPINAAMSKKQPMLKQHAQLRCETKNLEPSLPRMLGLSPVSGSPVLRRHPFDRKLDVVEGPDVEITKGFEKNALLSALAKAANGSPPPMHAEATARAELRRALLPVCRR